MIADLKPYPAMKDSGVEWLGEVPEHWEVLPGRACIYEKEEPNTGMVESTVLSLSYGRIIVKPKEKLRGLVPESFETYQVIDPGDVICRPTDLQNDRTSLRFGIARNRGIITSAYMCIKMLQQLEGSFGHLLLHAYDLKKIFYGLGSGLRQNLSWDDFKYLPCVTPPLPEQAAIVRYLDHVDRRVRRLVRAKRKLIALLTEQKQAIIHRAVTRGLDPDVPLKDSGVEWLGKVPEHWEVVPYKRRVGFQEGPGIMAADFRDSGVPLLRISCLRGDSATLDGCNYLDPEQVASRWSHFAVNAGDFLLSASGSTGAVTQATDVVEGSIPYTGIIRLWPAQSSVDMRFITLFMSSQLFQDQILVAKTGVGIEHFGPTHLKEMLLLLPPPAEQQAIAERASTEQIPIDTAIARAEREIELLNEYRTRLIADVVTGKLDVRDAAAALPEVDPLAAEEDVEEDDQHSEENEVLLDPSDEEALA